jgi:hypothetical protein
VQSTTTSLIKYIRSIRRSPGSYLAVKWRLHRALQAFDVHPRHAGSTFLPTATLGGEGHAPGQIGGSSCADVSRRAGGSSGVAWATRPKDVAAMPRRQPDRVRGRARPRPDANRHPPSRCSCCLSPHNNLALGALRCVRSPIASRVCYLCT